MTTGIKKPFDIAKEKVDTIPKHGTFSQTFDNLVRSTYVNILVFV